MDFPCPVTDLQNLNVKKPGYWFESACWQPRPYCSKLRQPVSLDELLVRIRAFFLVRRGSHKTQYRDSLCIGCVWIVGKL